jgi:putative ABC transport system permease protein
MNYTYLDAARLSGKGTMQRLIARIRNPVQAAEISSAIDAMFANSPVATRTETEKDFAEAQLSQIGDIGFIVNAIISAVFFTLLLLVGNSLMRAFRERRREFAVLKALGFSDGKVAALVIAEAISVCGISVLAGLGLARIALPLLGRATGGLLPALMPLSVPLAGAFAALLVAIAGGAIPALLARRLSIVDALSAH